MTKFFLLHPYNVRAYRNLHEEVDIAKRYLWWAVGTDLTQVKEGKVIIPRYRMLPFAQELDIEARNRGATLINSYHEHRAIADVGNWWRDLWEANLTPQRFTINDYVKLPEGEYFVKGETNSLKNNWFEACYAKNKEKLLEVIHKNQTDSYIGSQPIQIQPFQHYRQIATAVDGRPVFNEIRAFIYKGDVLSHANYWTSIEEAHHVKPLDYSKFEKALAQAVDLTSHLATFYVIDLVETPEGDWKVIELNDGVMSGLSDNKPDDVFGKLYRVYGN